MFHAKYTMKGEIIMEMKTYKININKIIKSGKIFY